MVIGASSVSKAACSKIAVVNLFPQTQQFSADYNHTQLSNNVANPVTRELFGTTVGQRAFNDMAVGPNLSWEIDFWGRFRRGVEASNAELDGRAGYFGDVTLCRCSGALA